MDETYVRIRGKWAYFCRALDKEGRTIDFRLIPTVSVWRAKLPSPRKCQKV